MHSAWRAVMLPERLESTRSNHSLRTTAFSIPLTVDNKTGERSHRVDSYRARSNLLGFWRWVQTHARLLKKCDRALITSLMLVHARIIKMCCCANVKA
ncbi:hypothetical protein BHE74_00059603 [Ensete ventricosum]|nr:hypothetical protein BHE74_00059603 [Ensete ventricosum]